MPSLKILSIGNSAHIDCLKEWPSIIFCVTARKSPPISTAFYYFQSREHTKNMKHGSYLLRFWKFQQLLLDQSCHGLNISFTLIPRRNNRMLHIDQILILSNIA